MKKVFFILFALNLFILSLEAQNNEKIIHQKGDTDCNGNFDIPDDRLNELFVDVCFDKKASYSEGFELLQGFIHNNFKISKDLEQKKGRIFIEFVIEKDGTLSNYKVIRDLGFDSGLEAIRVLKLTKGWIPASHKGKIVRTKFTLPILIDNTK